MSDSSLAAANAAASPLVDEFLSLLDKAIDIVGEDAVTALINEKIDVPILNENAEAIIIGYAVKRLHARIHKPAPTT